MEVNFIYSVIVILPWIVVLSSAITINVCSIVCEGGALPYCIGRSGPALDIGIEKLKRKIPDVNVNFYVERLDRKCGPQDVGAMAAELYHRYNASVFIGPACSARVETVGLMADSWNIPILTPVGTSTDLGDKTLYKTLTRLSYDQNKLGKFFLNVLREFSWRNIIIFYDVIYPLFIGIGEGLHERFLSAGMTSKLENFNSTDKQYDSATLLELGKKVSRVFVLACHADTLRTFMLTARNHGMTQGEYAFLYYRPFIGDSFGDHSWKRDDNLDKAAKEAYESLLIVNLLKPNSSEFTDFEMQVKQEAMVNYNFDYEYFDVNLFVTAFHDAFVIYGEVINETISEGGDIFDGEAITRKMWNRTFDGITGKIHIDENGDRETDYTLLDMDHTSGNFNVVGFYRGSNGEFEWHESNKIHWPRNAGPPPNVPKCGFTGEKCYTYEFPTIGIVIICFSCAFVAVAAVAVIAYRYKRKENLIQSLWWKIDYGDITIDKDIKRSCSRISINELARASPKNSKQIFIKAGVYKGSLVAMKKLHIQSLKVDRQVQIELLQMRELQCNNITKFIGITEGPLCVYLLEEYCSRGSLEDIVQNESIQLDFDFRLSLIADVVKGMTYLHNSSIIVHGRLSSSNCVIDSRFVLKISDFGLPSIRAQSLGVDRNKTKKFHWTAPEVLRRGSTRMDTIRKEDLQAADVYSFGMIVYEITTRKYPFEDELDHLTVTEIFSKIKAGANPAFRPQIPSSIKEQGLIRCMQSCWAEDPRARPPFATIKKELQASGDSLSSDSFLDKLLRRMERYANNLEELVEERTHAFLEEKKRAEELLYQLLPRSVADDLKLGRSVQAEAFECVTIYFSDIVGFTSLSSESSPIEVVDFLNDLYTAFDEVIDHFDVYKVETIGDAYMVVSGLPIRNGDQHVVEIAKMALAILDIVRNFRIRHLPDRSLQIRIGIHSGPVCAGVVGRKMPRYCLFGDTVNTASRMESNGQAMRIHVSEATYTMLEAVKSFCFYERGDVSIKGKGMMRTYWLISEETEQNENKCDGVSLFV